jgi:hypothetical protein
LVFAAARVDTVADGLRKLLEFGESRFVQGIQGDLYGERRLCNRCGMLFDCG